ncbi:MAG: anti-repressor protein [Methanothermococcus sp.]|uniref:phage antirepressor n=1 Tax=Methanothermococcus sp. TaxID=2614238 RepID=UPI002582E51E|nr:phage antirepressor [Methanothermococcus sp.]MDK2790627.1 anti-repressor protein [Methanothermococcus sp.]
MNNNIEIFTNEEFGEVRTVVKDNEIWFVAKDVCDILDIRNTTQAVNRLDSDERTIFNIGRQGNTNFINEYGLYGLILSSKKKEAKNFKRWIKHEVLPSIRKHGAYMTEQTIEKALTSPDFLIQLATQLKEEKEKRLEIESELKQAKPKILFADSVSTSESTILIRDLAKLLKQNGVNIGEKRLFAWLRENGYLIKQKGQDYNSPTQKAMDLKLFKIKETAINTSSGVKIKKTSLITGKGQNYFVNKFLGGKK